MAAFRNLSWVCRLHIFFLFSLVITLIRDMTEDFGEGLDISHCNDSMQLVLKSSLIQK